MFGCRGKVFGAMGDLQPTPGLREHTFATNDLAAGLAAARKGIAAEVLNEEELASVPYHKQVLHLWTPVSNAALQVDIFFFVACCMCYTPTILMGYSDNASHT